MSDKTKGTEVVERDEMLAALHADVIKAFEALEEKYPGDEVGVAVLAGVTQKYILGGVEFEDFVYLAAKVYEMAALRAPIQVGPDKPRDAA